MANGRHHTHDFMIEQAKTNKIEKLELLLALSCLKMERNKISFPDRVQEWFDNLTLKEYTTILNRGLHE